MNLPMYYIPPSYIFVEFPFGGLFDLAVFNTQEEALV